MALDGIYFHIMEHYSVNRYDFKNVFCGLINVENYYIIASP